MQLNFPVMMLLLGFALAAFPAVGSETDVDTAMIRKHFGMVDNTSYIIGRVEESMDAAGYTYVRIALGPGHEAWVASNTFAIKKGDWLRFKERAPQKDFTSKTLKRTFSEIYFVEDLEVAKAH